MAWLGRDRDATATAVGGRCWSSTARRLLRPCPRAAGRAPARSSAACSASSGATAWARRRSATRSPAWCRASGSVRLAGERDPRPAAQRDHRARHRLCAAGTARLAVALGRRDTAPGRRGAKARGRARLRDVPAPGRAPRATAAPSCPAASSRCWRSAAPCCANPRLLVMDEPTEGLAPVIVDQVVETLRALAAEGEIAVLLIEQNLGVAIDGRRPRSAVMVNGRIAREMPAARARRRPRAAAAAARACAPADRRVEAPTAELEPDGAGAAAPVPGAPRAWSTARPLDARAADGAGRAAPPAAGSPGQSAGGRAHVDHRSRPSRGGRARSHDGSGAGRSMSGDRRQPAAAPPMSPAPSTPRAASSPSSAHCLERLGLRHRHRRSLAPRASRRPPTCHPARGGAPSSAGRSGRLQRRSRRGGRRHGRGLRALHRARAATSAALISAGGSGGTALVDAGHARACRSACRR